VGPELNQIKKKSGVDRNGQVVERDDLVRLLAIRPSILERLAGVELVDVASMLGQVLKVFDVYDDGLVWVSLSWPRDDGVVAAQAIAVDAEAIELVSKARDGASS
jgi:hypothetical protein